MVKGWRPFWLHQGSEYLLGLVLVAAGLQAATPTWPTTVGGLIIVNAAFVDGPLGAFKAVPRSLHRRLDVAVMAVILLVAALPVLSIDGISRVTLVAVAVVMAIVWLGTDFERRRKVPTAATDRSDAVGRAAGRLVAKAARAARNRHG